MLFVAARAQLRDNDWHVFEVSNIDSKGRPVGPESSAAGVTARRVVCLLGVFALRRTTCVFVLSKFGAEGWLVYDEDSRRS